MATEGKRDENFKEKSIRLEELPSELLLKIFSFLDITNLLKCSQTSKRIRSICYDDSLWQKINLRKMTVPTEFLQKVIGYGCKSLNLSKANSVGTLRLENKSQLTNLDLLGCSATSHVFEELLKSCHYLEKLTFTQQLDFNTLTSQNGKSLIVLNCWWEFQPRSGKNIDLTSLQSIIENCTELKELNFWNEVVNSDGENINYHCGFSNDAINMFDMMEFLVKSISPNIEKFSVFECPFDDQHIKVLLSRCTKIKDLRFGYLDLTNDSVTHIIDHLKPTLEKLNLTGIIIMEYQNMFQLKLMPKLKSLDCLCTSDINVISELRNELPNVSVNGYPPLTLEEEKS
jgi:hypothetical protein